MQPPSLHSNFFSSLKQVEKRLKLEDATQQPFNVSKPPPSTPIDTNYTSTTESLSTPIYIHTDQEPNNNNNSLTSLQESSGPPLAFLSLASPLHSSPTLQNPPQECLQNRPNSITESKTSGVDDIEVLMQILGLSDFKEREQGKEKEEKERVCGSCGCEGGFYEKIVGVKGPKCKKEVERLEGWIRYFSGNGGAGGGVEERREPLRLAFLLLGKAAFQLEGDDGGGFDGLEFPSTIEEFLKIDPPRD